MTESVVLHPVAREPAESAAVTVMKGAVGGHVGLFYQCNDDGARRHLHLAWHLRLDDEPAAPPDAFWVEPRLTQDELDNIADAAHRVATLYQDGLVPYAFDANARFDSNGRLQLEQSLGLTCATFIIRLFEYAGIVLLDEQTWDRDRSAERRREDTEAQRAIVERLRREYPAHAELVAREVGCTRIRAEEVAAASGLTGCPIPFARAEPEGRRVLAMIHGQRADAA